MIKCLLRCDAIRNGLSQHSADQVTARCGDGMIHREPRPVSWKNFRLEAFLDFVVNRVVTVLLGLSLILIEKRREPKYHDEQDDAQTPDIARLIVLSGKHLGSDVVRRPIPVSQRKLC